MAYWPVSSMNLLCPKHATCPVYLIFDFITLLKSDETQIVKLFYTS